ncbi:hypothetical protein LZ32DRAFT_394739 [Colletotrichum eremochloae]|nr:hypothetical protein LZ32DRAFT_394739 [Colletotrichum eremochloae]
MPSRRIASAPSGRKARTSVPSSPSYLSCQQLLLPSSSCLLPCLTGCFVSSYPEFVPPTEQKKKKNTHTHTHTQKIAGAVSPRSISKELQELRTPPAIGPPTIAALPWPSRYSRVGKYCLRVRACVRLLLSSLPFHNRAAAAMGPSLLSPSRCSFFLFTPQFFSKHTNPTRRRHQTRPKTSSSWTLR